MPATKPANRPVLLTLAMWVLLACSIGGAALLAQLKGGAWRVALTAPQTIGSVELRLPAGWEVDHSRRGASEFIEATDPKTNRRLSIRATDLDEQVGPMDFLLNSDLVRLMTLDREDIRLVEDIKVPGGSGFIIHPKRGTPLAVITYADSRAVTVQLADQEESSASDDAIVYHVASSIRLTARSSEPRPAPRTEREI
jgi:hypothetical protein